MEGEGDPNLKGKGKGVEMGTVKGHVKAKEGFWNGKKQKKSFKSRAGLAAVSSAPTNPKLQSFLLVSFLIAFAFAFAFWFLCQFFLIAFAQTVDLTHFGGKHVGERERERPF